MKAFFVSLGLFLMLATACKNNSLAQEKTTHSLFTHRLSDTLIYQTGIRCIFQDSKGNYWFGSDWEGACMFDGTHFRYFNKINGLGGEQIYTIQEDENGNIYFNSNKGLYRYDGTTINEISFKNAVSTPSTLWNSTQNTLPIQTTWENTTNGLLFGLGKNVVYINKQKNYFLKCPITPKDEIQEGLLRVTAISQGKTGNLWVANYSGVWGYDKQKLIILTDSVLQYDGKSAYLHVRSILEDSKQRLWIGNNGIGVLLRENSIISPFSQQHNLVQGEIFQRKSPPNTLMHVFAMAEDKHGNIWFGDRDTGAWRYDGKEIKNFIINPQLKMQHIWHIYEDKQGNLHFAMGDKGVYLFNEEKFERVF